MGVRDNNISLNTISESGFGIWITWAYNTLIYRNNISHNGNIGVWTFITSADHILQNNFIGNNRSAISYQSFMSKISMLKNKLHVPIRRNVWSQNYWDAPRILPYVIPGVFLKVTTQVDWRPALKPYLIP
jgi:parallel beta-helix repeat protein